MDENSAYTNNDWSYIKYLKILILKVSLLVILTGFFIFSLSPADDINEPDTKITYDSEKEEITILSLESLNVERIWVQDGNGKKFTEVIDNPEVGDKFEVSNVRSGAIMAVVIEKRSGEKLVIKTFQKVD